MATYWMNFRIKDDKTYSDRYDALMTAIGDISTGHWADTTSFIVFASAEKMDSVAETLKNAINPDTDLIVIGMPDFKIARLIGETQDNDIFDLIPFIKYA